MTARQPGWRLRLAVLIGVVLAATVGAAGYVIHSRAEGGAVRATAPDVAAGADVIPIQSGPHLAFRNTALGDAYGHVAVVPLAAPDGPRVITPAVCDRVYAKRQGRLPRRRHGFRQDLPGPVARLGLEADA